MSIHKGEFNSLLKKTGFLSQPKMESRLIARHPHRFLEHYADRKIGILRSENEALESFIEDVKAAGDYDRKESILVQKQQETKSRSFLLSLASSPAISEDLMKDFQLDSLMSQKANGKDKEATVDYETIIENYLTQIKMADKEDIENWIATHITIRDIKLPYGLPDNLRMPTDSTKVGDNTLQDFIENANDEFLLLDGEYHTKMEDLFKKLAENHISITENSPWTIAESALLFYITTSFEETSPTPLASSLLTDLTKRIFPRKSREEVITHKYKLKMKRVLEEKRGNVIRDWIRDKKELQDKINLAWAALHKERVKKLEKSMKIAKQKQVCQEWSSLLKKMRQAKSEKVKKIQTIVEPICKSMEEKEKVKTVKEFERKMSVKSSAKVFKEKKMKEDTILKQKKVAEQKIVEDTRKKQIQVAKPRVNMRKQEYDTKCQMRKEMEAKMEEERKRRAAILESIKEQVEVEYDSERAAADTHASMVRRHEIMRERRNKDNNEEDMVKFFQQQYWFSTETVLMDRRVRLEGKLREAGLLQSSYARQILKAMEPKHKPHLETNIKFQQDE